MRTKNTRRFFVLVVVYGIGGPVLLFTNDTFAKDGQSLEGQELAALFSLASVWQVILAALNKFLNWGIYFGEF